MGDLETGGNKMKGNPFFVFSKPYLDFIGKGRIFSFVYIIMAVINLIIPFVIIYITIDSGAFGFGAKFIFAAVSSWLVIMFANWIGFQIWWNRRAKIAEVTSYEFVATICFSEILQTFGEWLGTLLGIIGAGVGLIAFIFFGNDASNLFRLIGLDFMRGPMIIVIGPVAGFFIIILFRFLAEQLRLFASLVNNTKDIASNNKSKGY